jgi:transcriptional pleiotropic regulator of transition state genes
MFSSGQPTADGDSTLLPHIGNICVPASLGCLNGRRITVDTLIVRKIDDLGRVVVPAETRRLFNIHDGDELAITVENGGIVLRKLEASCIFCGSTQGVEPFKDRGVCAECREGLLAP